MDSNGHVTATSIKRNAVFDSKGYNNAAFEDVDPASSHSRANEGRRNVEGTPNQVIYSWKDISATVKAKKKRSLLPCLNKSNSTSAEAKNILQNVSGTARPGEILTIMGASGAGKTTLLNILTFRNSTNSLKVSGSRMVNNVPIDADTMTLLSAYIQQEDIFIGTLTPREHLRFQAQLRMERDIPYKEKMRRVEEVMREMGLASCADTLIGIPGAIKGISGGQKKRLSVASEILTDPKLLICDEPTTGLDSFMAQNLIKTLKGLSSKGKTIICTIHQPASEIFALFDRLLLMSEGRVAYYGDAQQATHYFSSIGYPCPETYNLADFFIQTLAIRVGKEDACLQRSKEICDKYEESDLAKELARNMSEEVSNELMTGLTKEAKLRKVSPYKASWLTQFRVCLWRSWITVLKNPMVLKIQFAQSVFLALVIGVIYFGQDMDQEGIQNISGCIFIIIANLTFSSIFPVTNVFWQELPVFMKEHFNGTYRTDAFYLAKTVAELPVYLCLPAIYMSIAYYMVGFNPDVNRFFIAIAITVLLANVGSSFGYMASTLSSSFEATMAIAPVMITPFMLFGGSFLNKDSVPVYFVWLKYMSWFLHANEALSVNQWKGVTNITCNSNANFTCTETGEQVLENLSFKEDNFWIAIAVLGSLIIVTRFLSFIGLLLKTRRPSN